MHKSYAATQVCQISLSRSEVQKIVLESLLKLGGDPSYDFATSHPIFLWDDEGGLRVRFVQQAVVAKEEDRWFTLKPVKTEREIEAELAKRANAVKS